MWIMGKAGSGKSTVMKHTIEEAEAMHKTDPSSQTAVAGFFFNARGVMSEKSPDSLFRALLWQIFYQIRTLFPFILKEYQRKSETQGRIKWELEDLKRIFSSLKCSTEMAHIFIFIDALDEMKGTPGNLVHDVVSLLERTINSSRESESRESPIFSICFASRPIQSVDQWWPAEYVRFSMQEENAADIKKYVEDILDPFQNLNPTVDLKSYGAMIIKKADGVFLWVRLVVEGLLDDLEGATPNDLSERLREVPQELSDVYSRMVQDMQPKRRPEILNMLRLALFSTQPLRLSDFRMALATGSDRPPKSFKQLELSTTYIRTDKQMESRLRNFSAGLLEVKNGLVVRRDEKTKRWIEERGDAVQVIHQSVIDFFLEEAGLRFLQDGQKETWFLEAHEYLLWSCINTIILAANSEAAEKEVSNVPTPTSLQGRTGIRAFSSPTFASITDRENTFCTYYAIKYWTHHAALSSLEIQGKIASHLLARGGTYFAFWLRAHRKLGDHVADFIDNASDDIMHDPSLLYIASKYNLIGLARALIKSHNFDVDTVGGTFCTALGVAVYMGWSEMTEMLLQEKADVNHRGGWYGCPLQAAAWASDTGMISELLNLGADVNQEGGLYGNPLQAAVAGGSVDVVRILLERGAIVDAVGGMYGSTIQAACRCGNREIVDLLFDHMTFNSLEDTGTDVGEIQLLISVAASAGYVDILGVLLRICGDNIRDVDLREVMEAASARDELMVVGLLESYLINPKGENDLESQLILAASNGMIEVLEFQLNCYKQTICSAVLERAHEAAVRNEMVATVELLQRYKYSV